MRLLATKAVTLLAGLAAAAVMQSEARAGGCGSSRSYRPVYHHRYVKPHYYPKTYCPPAPKVVYCKPAPKVYCPPKPVVKVVIPSVPDGSTLTLPGASFGPHPGAVILAFSEAKLHVRVLHWDHHGVEIQMPSLGLAAPATAELLVKRHDQSLAPPIPLKILPAPPPPVVPIVHTPSSPEPPVEIPRPIRIAPNSPAPGAPQGPPIQQNPGLQKPF